MIQIATGKYCKEDKFYGLDGQYFKIPFNVKLKPYDILKVKYDAGYLVPIQITNEPIEHVIDEFNASGITEYWVHTVVIYTEKTYRFIPREYLLPGTLFNKIN